MYFIAQIKRNYSNLMFLNFGFFSSIFWWEKWNEDLKNDTEKFKWNKGEEYKVETWLEKLNTKVELSKEKLLNLTNKELLSYSKEERLKYITEWNIDYSKVKSWEVKEITFLFWDWKDKKELFKKTTVWQVLWKEIFEIKVWEINYKRNWLDWEFFNWNRRLRIFTWTKVEIVKIREKNELNELKLNFDNEFNKKIEEFKINEKYKETIDKNSDIIEEAIKRWIKVEMIYDLFSWILSKYQWNERKVILEDLFTEVNRVRSRYWLEENSEKLKEYLKDDDNDWELDEIKMHFKDIDFSEIWTWLNWLFNFISFAEWTHWNYNAIYWNWEQNEIDFTNMTINEILIYQESYWNKHWSSAIWKYQIIEDTLKGLVDKNDINKNDKFSPEMQDNLAKLLIKWSLEQYLQDKNINKFLLTLSKIWASIPKDESWLSYYHNDWLNKATVSFEDSILAIQNILIS